MFEHINNQIIILNIQMSLPPLSSIKLPPLEKVSLPKPEEVKPSITLPKSPGIQSEKKEVKPSITLPKLSGIKPEKKKDPRDILKYLDTFFPIRNNIKPKPVETVNYTVETLTYMSSATRADQITKIIVDKMKSLNKDIPFGMFECCAGMGGNTLSFLESPDISYVVSYEILPERREMLKKNIAMYDLSQKSYVPDEGFNGVPDKYQGVVLYMDPPWLPPSIKGHESTKADYILQGMKVAGKTLEEWVESCRHCSMIVMRVPPGYRLGNVPGFKIESELLGKRKKNSLLITAIPEKKVVHSSPKPKVQDLNYQKWREGLKSFLRDNILRRILPSEAAREKMVSDEAMKVWEVAFTHESFNPNIGENYEELELYGDRVMGVNFLKYMLQKYPKITRSELSELRTNYLAKKFQSDLSQSLGMGEWVRTRFKKSTHMFEDILESFFGALDRVGDMVFKFGAGQGLAYNMVVDLYKDVEIDWVLTKGNPKTRIKEIFEGLGWVNPKEGEKVPEQAIEDENGNVTFTISITPRGMDHLRQLGVPVTTPIIARETDTTKKKASVEAYKSAVRNLERLGITDEWVQQVKGQRDLNNPELSSYVAGVQNRLLQEGYERFYFNEYHVKSTVPGVKTRKYVQMIGVTPKGRKDILTMTREPVENLLEGKKQVLSDYAQGK